MSGEVETLRSTVATLNAETTDLRTKNQELSSLETEQSAEIERLTSENLRYRAGARWPEMFTGASILGIGMFAGAAVHSFGSSRSKSRVRL